MSLDLGQEAAMRWSDNALDVISEDERMLKVWGLKGRKAAVRMAYIGGLRCGKGRVADEQ